MKFISIALLSVLLASCGNENQCKNKRSFDSRLFQQSWFISETPSVESLGVGFGDASGTFYVPIKIDYFEYCAQGNTLFISNGGFWKKREKIEVVDLNHETMTLKFQNGMTYKYYRAGR